MRWRFFVFGFLILVAVLQGIYYYPKLPDPVASHFGGGGLADGWMSKPAFLGFMAAMLLLMVFVFTVLPIFLMRLPTSMINLPNKDYWLAPPRREQTCAVIRGYMLEIGAATLLLLVGVNQLAIQANLQGAARLPMTPFWIFLATYLVFIAVWIIRLYRRFPKIT